MLDYKLVTGASHPEALIVTVDKDTLREAYPDMPVHIAGAVLQALYDAASETGISRDVIRDTVDMVESPALKQLLLPYNDSPLYPPNCALSYIRFADYYIIIARLKDDVRIHTHKTPLPDDFYCTSQLDSIVKAEQLTASWNDCVEIPTLGNAPYSYLAYALDNAYLVGAVDFSGYEEITDDHYIYVINDDWDFLGDIEYNDVDAVNDFINGERHDYECATLYYLMYHLNESFGDALDKLDDYRCVNDTLEGCAEDILDKLYLADVPTHLHSYIDYAKYAHDCRQSGDMCEFEYGSSTWTCINANQ